MLEIGSVYKTLSLSQDVWNYEQRWPDYNKIPMGTIFTVLAETTDKEDYDFRDFRILIGDYIGTISLRIREIELEGIENRFEKIC